MFLDIFRELARTVHHFEEQIFNYWDCPIKIINGYTECSNRLLREDNLRGRGYSFEVLRGRTLFRKTNLQKLLNHDLITIGPVIPANGCVFHFEGVHESETDDKEVRVNPETGEIFE